jgi:hypothetical protein
MDSDSGHSVILLSSLGVGLLAALLALMLKGSGTLVSAGGRAEIQPAESKTELNTVVYGPYELKDVGRIHDIKITYKPSLTKNGLRWCEFELLNEKKEPVGEFGHEFWAESGRDSEGSWSESDKKFTQQIVLKEAGKYYIAASGDKPAGSGFAASERKLKARNKKPDYSFKESDFKVEVKSGAFDVGILWWVVGICAIYPGLAFLVYCIQNSD